MNLSVAAADAAAFAAPGTSTVPAAVTGTAAAIAAIATAITEAIAAAAAILRMLQLQLLNFKTLGIPKTTKPPLPKCTETQQTTATRPSA